MIRTIVPGDNDDVIALGETLEMFDAEGLGHVRATLDSHHAGESDDIWLVADEGLLAGVLYCAPEPMTNGTWNVLMLMISPDYQGQGQGVALMDQVEKMLARSGQRLIIVDTSSLADYQRARAFYPQCGYTEEARIKDFWDSGDDKIVFTKSIA